MHARRQGGPGLAVLDAAHGRSGTGLGTTTRARRQGGRGADDERLDERARARSLHQRERGAGEPHARGAGPPGQGARHRHPVCVQPAPVGASTDVLRVSLLRLRVGRTPSGHQGKGRVIVTQSASTLHRCVLHRASWVLAAMARGGPLGQGAGSPAPPQQRSAAVVLRFHPLPVLLRASAQAGQRQGRS